jgi:hypothetical protein
MNGTDDLSGMDSVQIRAVLDELSSRMGQPQPEAPADGGDETA